MAKIVAAITTSVDGYITGPDDGPADGPAADAANAGHAPAPVTRTTAVTSRFRRILDTVSPVRGHIPVDMG